jgi:hypothetical protein
MGLQIPEVQNAKPRPQWRTIWGGSAIALAPTVPWSAIGILCRRSSREASRAVLGLIHVRRDGDSHRPGHWDKPRKSSLERTGEDSGWA